MAQASRDHEKRAIRLRLLPRNESLKYPINDESLFEKKIDAES
jgi:hypothetical protein